MQTSRTFVVSTVKGGTPREETFNGRAYLAVPVVALVEGVIHAMNSKYAELVTAEEFSRAPAGWNGRPVFHGHPMRDGKPVIGNTPEVLEAEQIGLIFNAAVKRGKLAMEAWIDVERAEAIAPKLLARLRNGDPVEISVGVFVSTDEADKGEHGGKKYAGQWADIVPDHLALLPEDEIGACSREMGCGVRAAAKKGAHMKKDQKSESIFAKVLQLFRVEQAADAMSDVDLKRRLYEALKEVEPTITYVEAFVPVTDPKRVVYCCWIPSGPYGVETGMGYQTELLDRGFSLAEDGAITLADDRREVEVVVSYQPVPGESAPEPVAAASGCGCKDHQRPATAAEEKNAMEKTERVKALVGKLKDKGFDEGYVALFANASDEQLDNLEKQLLAEPTPAAKVEETPVVVAPVVETPAVASAATFEDVLKTASADVREMVEEGLRVGKAKKDASIKTLKDSGRCDLTDAQLAELPQAELDKLVKLAGVTVAATDFALRGLPRSGDKTGTVPAAPDLGKALKAAKK